MNKRGELSSYYIIMIVLGVIGFIIILAVLYGIYTNQYSSKEICKLSVLSRATAPSAASSYVPLKCTTGKICITDPSVSGYGNCEDTFGPDSTVQTIKLSGKDAGAKAEKIEEVAAGAMYDCWDMMGRGKLDLFSTNMQATGLTKVESTCVVCSRVAVDKSVLDNAQVLGLVSINKYLETAHVPGSSLTYAQAFGADSSTQSFHDAKQANFKVDDKTIETSGISGQSSAGTTTNEITFVFMQIRAYKISEVIKTQLGVASGAAAFTFATPIIRGVAWRAVTAVVSSPELLLLTVIAGVGVMRYGAYNANEGQIVAAGYCGPMTKEGGETEHGCSIVKAMQYDYSSLNNLCHTVEGTP